MSTPHKSYDSSDGVTPSTNNRSSRDDFASPETALTNYTPEMIRKSNVDLGSLMNGLQLKGTPSRHSMDDPFIDHSAAARSFNLSATAADYAPVSSTAPTHVSPRSLARSSSSPSNATTVHRPGQQVAASGANLTSAEVTRYVKIAGPIEDELGMTRIKDVKTMESSIATKKLDDGALIFRFDHVQQAQMAYKTTLSLFELGSFIPGWTATYVSAADFHGDHSRDYEGHLKVAITYLGEGQCSEADLLDVALSAIQTQTAGGILSSAAKSFDPEKCMLVLDVALASVRAAEAVSVKYNREWKSLPEHEDINMFLEHNCSKFPISSKPWVSSRSALGVRGHGNAMSPYSPNRDGYISPNAKDAKVNPKAIEVGDDVRTTVMIRNIPNKIDAAMFKTILDEHVFGRYDFSYLRIDFTNNCNVGYAFVNFKNPRDIITLYNGIVSKPWEVFSSDKIADVCYATNQGLGTCIEKFRNSSVMLEWAPHRPKLWYTLEDGEHLAGTEKPFPEPSNLQKLHRSRANANSIGLFPPRGVQVSALGLSPTRGARGDMQGHAFHAAYGHSYGPSTGTRAHHGGPIVMPMYDQPNSYTDAFAQARRHHSMPPRDAMYDHVHRYPGEADGDRRTRGSPNGGGYGGPTFMPQMPYGYPGNMPPRY